MADLVALKAANAKHWANAKLRCGPELAKPAAKAAWWTLSSWCPPKFSDGADESARNTFQPESQIVVFGQRCLDSGIAAAAVKEYLRPSPVGNLLREPGHGQLLS
jgi:hypothetical protein